MSDGNLPRRGRPRDASKDEAILVAAGELFMERGFEAASLDAVAQAASVSKATIYSRFADKETLFRAVLDHECNSVLLPASFVPPPGASVRETLILIAEQFLGLVLGDHAMAMHRIIVAECCRAPRVAELFFETAVLSTKTRLADWMRQQNAAGRLAVRDPDGAAWRFLGAVKVEAYLRASMGLPAIEPERLRAHVEACADEFCRAHAPD
jgi:TetR/AcrR family transcriptional repressor of mexJK operon